MSSLKTFGQMLDHTLRRLGMAATRRDDAKVWINEAMTDVCEAHDWPELLSEGQFNTVAEYTAGTVTFTNGDATVEGSGTTFTGLADRKIAKAYGEPHFGIESITDADTLEMAKDWPFDTATATTYVIYQDVYSLDPTVDKLYKHLVTLHDDDGHLLCSMTHVEGVRYTDFPETSGYPEVFWTLGRDTSGRKQIQLGHRAPDDVYVVNYWYRRRHEDMTDDDSRPLLDANLLEVVCEGAMVRAYSMPEFRDTDLAERQERRYMHKLAEKIRRRRDESPGGVRPGTFDQNVSARRMHINYPVDNS